MLLSRALAAAEASLPPRDAKAFDAVIRRDAPHYAEASHQLGAAREALDRQIAADNFDRDATRQAFGVWQADWNRFIDAFGNTLVDALAQVSPEGRQKLIIERHRTQGQLHAP